MIRIEKRKRIFAAPMFLVAIAGFSLITMLLWNALLPEVFHLPQISFWQATGLLVLSRLLFGFKSPWGGHPNHRRDRDIREKWEQMSPNERDEFKQHWSKHRVWWKKSKEDPTNQENHED